MRLVLVDDDDRLRGVIGELLEGRGHTVVGEAAAGLTGGELVRSLRPDAVVVDLALHYGSGNEVIEVARETGTQVIVFSAYIQPADALATPGALFVDKPNFLGLEAAVDAAAGRLESGAGGGQVERRRRPTPERTAGHRSTIDGADDFYRALADAAAGDALLCVDVHDDAIVDSVVPVARAVLRGCDHLTVRGTQITMLLVGDGSDAHVAVTHRLHDALAGSDAWSYHVTVVRVDEPPSDALARLRTMTASPVGSS